MILNERYTLENGVEVPKLGLGTWCIDDEHVADVVRAGIEIGYRSIDSAQAYANERGVGEGIRTSGVPREQLFVTTKLAAEIKDYHQAVVAIEESAKTLDLEYIDLMLIHAPQPWHDFRGGDYAEGNRLAWRALEEAYRAGTVRAIGVSNFLQEDVENILESCTVRPMVNQILVHSGNTPTELIEYCKSQRLLIEAYSPIAHGQILTNGDIVSMAAWYGVSVAQLCIRYTLQLGAVSLPKTTSPEHMRSNSELDFEISTEDMAALRGLRITPTRS
ncbi:aldo/keto reductase [Arthrobacter sp. RAF14]|uniref:aldo/keto reductase n=1 Tax=Arthrobacter sp. RAF14 TaxID=3233051 RepID=UPI003F92FDC1